MPLDLEYAFCSPFRAKPFSFFPFTGGAITLATIKAIQRMAVSAMSLLRIHVSDGRRIALRILRSCDGVQMCRIDTVAMSAGVIDDIASRNRQVRQPHCHAMRFSCCAPKREDSVSVFIYLSRPQEAIAGTYSLRFETRDFRRCSCRLHGNKVNTAFMVHTV